MRTQHAFELVAKPSADLAALCGAAFTATDRKISTAADNHVPKLSPDKKLAACFNSFIEHDAMTIDPLVGSHLWFSGFMVVEEELVADVMMHCSELACMSTATKTRGLNAMIISGNLNAWKAAIGAGLGSCNDMFQLFSTVKRTFDVAGYGDTTQNRGLIN
jgi:hypothetical protein